jgi:tetratricopeptide (TPR) repeat protein
MKRCVPCVGADQNPGDALPSLATKPAAFPRRSSPRSRPASLAIALACAFGAARAGDLLLDAAAARLGARDAAGAYALLADAETQRAGMRDFDYLLGVAALDSGHVTRAIFALERLVQSHPDDTLGHAELGRAYLAAGDPAQALQELRLARQGSAPADAAAAIDRVIGVIDQKTPPSGPRLSGYLEFGAGHDSNVNSATNQGEFAVPGFGGILFTTAPESRRHADQFAAAAGGVDAQLALSPTWKLTAAANLHVDANRVVHDMDTDLLDATLAASHTDGVQSQTIALQDGTAWVGSSLYRSATGASAQWQAQFDSSSQGSVFTQWSHQAYSGQEERNTHRSVLGVGYGRGLASGATLVYGSAYGAEELASSTASAHFGHHATGLRLGLEQRVSETLGGFLEWQHELRRYGGTEPFFDVARRDRQDDVSAGLRWRLDAHWQLLPQARYTRAESNIVLYDYARSVFQITAHRSFP